MKSPFKKGGMFNGADPLIFGLAKDLRKNMTHAEMILWQYLKEGINGVKFRRQHPVGMYIADFYCHKIKLIIEVDGKIHERENIKQNDIEREEVLKKQGYIILRFTNNEVEKEIEKVLLAIKEKIETSPSKSP